jgi:hypothetical protein
MRQASKHVYVCYRSFATGFTGFSLIEGGTFVNKPLFS